VDRTGSAGLLGRETVGVCYGGWREGGEEIPLEIHADSDFAAVGLRDDCVDDPEEDEGCEADVEAWKAFGEDLARHYSTMCKRGLRRWPRGQRECARREILKRLQD